MMTRAAWVGLAIGLTIIVGGLWFLYGSEPASELPSLSEAREDLAEVTEPVAQEPEIAHPLPEPEAGGTPLPEIDNSDEEVLAKLRELFGREPVESFIVPKEPIRRFVLTVDSLDREDPLPLWLRPLRRVAGQFVVDRSSDALTVSADNARRYDRLVAMVERADMAQLAATYRRYYPLFQDAYDRLGNPRARYFNDRLIGVIDHLLATPAVEEPIALAQPKVLFVYAEPELQALSCGQKVMLRIGRDHAARVQSKLREFRSAIAVRPGS